MNLLEIYKKYQIMPELMKHQLRVAGVADLICENFNPLPDPPHPSAGWASKGEGNLAVDRESIIKACLLHDMGNIVKFDFNQFPKMVAEKGLEYWQGVKKEIAEKYGANSHEATRNILKEIGVSERILELADCVGFDQAKDNMESEDFGKKICAYSDMRVLPFGVGSLEERAADLRVRYKNHPEGAQNRKVFENSLKEIEKQIFAQCKIRPEDITDKKIKLLVEELKGVEI